MSMCVPMGFMREKERPKLSLNGPEGDFMYAWFACARHLRLHLCVFVGG